MARTAVATQSLSTSEQRTAFQATASQKSTSPAWVWVVGGGVCGLAWATSLRAYMIELPGTESTFTWAGTFGAILVPGALAGGLLGWAEYRLSGCGPRWPRILYGPSGRSLAEPRTAWAAVLAVALYAVLALGYTIPFRRGESAAHLQKDVVAG